MNASGQVIVPVIENDVEKSITEPDPQKKTKKNDILAFNGLN